MSAILVMDPDAPLEFWEYPCQAAECERLYRFMREDGWLEWEPIDGFTVPDEKLTWSRPIDTFAVLERRLRERRPAATDHTLSRDEKVAASAA